MPLHTTDGQHLPEYQTAADQRLQKRNSRAPGYPAGDKAKCPLRSPIGSDAVAIFAEAGRRKPHTRSTSATMRGSPGSSLSTVTVIVHWSSLSACLACFPRDQIFSTAWSLGRSQPRLIYPVKMSMIFKRSMATAASFKKAGKVVCIGRNYAPLSDHVKELNNTRPKQPFFFLKPTSSILLPGAGPVLRPKGVDMHFEVELALILGKQVKDLKPDDYKGALAAIEAYAVSIDMTARNAQNEAKKKGLPWDIAKGFDTFLPMSDVIAKSAIADPHDVELFLKVNGETKQDASTNLMLFQIPRILSDISKVMTLEQGDIVLTGTPAGVGPAVPGDVIRAGIRVGGKELAEGNIEVAVEESPSSYVFAET
ncbi:fumarylacetoacetate hydrolase [Colletotrichum camelliae]|nr:fumarylacetoacetate hydrolase [Colletotrichum camelliae]